MIDILFTESAAGSIMQAKTTRYCKDSSTYAPFQIDAAPSLKADEVYSAVEEMYQISDVDSNSVEQFLRNTACFPLSLSIGDISEPFSDSRADYLQSMVRIYGPGFSEVGRELMQTARRSLELVCSAQEPVRIWYSRNPDEFCGFCHILTVLPRNTDIRVVELPEYEVNGNEIRTYTGWGDLEPMEFDRFRATERPLSDLERRRYICLWRELQSENGPLRAVINGRLCTVPLDFYDHFLLGELKNQPECFHEARFIGTVLGSCLPWLSDSFIALRLEEFISWGILIPATEPEYDSPIYHRYLRKGAAL